MAYSFDMLDLNVSSLPTLLVKTSSDVPWDTILTTLISSLILTVVPAFIAWWSIKNNNKTVSEDRKNQELSSKLNLSAQVISANRQLWINDLRNTMAEYVAEVRASVCMYKTMSRLAEKKANAGGDKTIFDNIDHYETIKEIDKNKYKIDILSNKINLLLNPKEVDSIKINSLMLEINKIGMYPHHNKTESLDVKISEIIDVTQTILKTEWDRVKDFS